MSKLLPDFKKNIVDQIIESITSNTSFYYAFASNPVSVNTIVSDTNDDYSSTFEYNWNMLFGKKLSNTDIVHMIKNNPWTSNTVYDKYDNNSNTVYDNSNYYVVSDPITVGGYYHIYKCLDNNNNSTSTINPSSIATPTQATSFVTSDNYLWKYLCSVSYSDYNKFASTEYIPVYANSTIQSQAGNTSCGVETIHIINPGSGYNGYHSGKIQAVVNNTLMQIASDASTTDHFYDNAAIYLTNDSSPSAQLLKIENYESNSTGRWVYLTTESNTAAITPFVTDYKISPDVVIETDGVTETKAYCTINTTSNSINSIIILEKGTFVSWANVKIETSILAGGENVNLYPIVSSSGGNGFDPINELNIQALGISFSFNNSESNTISDNILYNKIGIIRDPHILNANFTKGDLYSNSTFSSLLKATVTPSHTFSVGEIIKGDSSYAIGKVAFSNTTEVHIVGDMHFTDDETVSNSSSANITSISISEISDIYKKDLKPLYVQNIDNVTRANNQSESYKIIIKI